MKEIRLAALALRLRIYRYRGSFPVAYRILRNYVRIEAKREHRNES
ncbi:YlcG family protein [Salmonella enterica]|nr:YlcG family protein [Salmonella enterica]